MATPTYAWKRFWYPRGSDISLGPGGHLTNPEGSHGRIFNPNLVALEILDEVPCLVLLGGPGIGKSTALEQWRKQRSSEWEAEGVVTVSLDLRSYLTDSRLVSDLFEGADFNTWLGSDRPLMLMLDSLDECLLRIDTVATLLVDELKRREASPDRLRLRIVCRSAVWPDVLENGLKDIYGPRAVHVYEMAPLRPLDIGMAAEANGIDPGTFIAEIHARDAMPFAVKPVTLNLLLRLFKRDATLPSSPRALYERGLRELCEETNESRRGSGRIGLLTADQRLAVASRIAAMLTLGGRDAVWIGRDQADFGESDSPVSELVGGSEEALGYSFEVNIKAVLETLDTDIFALREQSRLGFFHSTYGEFLAARYLTLHDTSPSQVMNLLTHSGDPEPRLAPQQQGTAAWLATMRRDIFRTIVDTDPDVVLRSEVSTATEDDRRELTARLLGLYNEERLLNTTPSSGPLYRKLKHASLADQVLEFIRDRSKNSLARSEALKIARFCELEACNEAALELFLDASEEEQIRTAAGCVLLTVGDETTKSRMKPLATGDHTEDTFDELKGIALTALWPTHLSAAELFGLLTAPKRENMFGTYQIFVHHLAETLMASDLPTVLAWVEQQPPRDSLPLMFQDLMDAILIRAWGYLDYPVVVNSFAKTCLKRLSLDATIVVHFPEGTDWIGMVSNQDKRRRVLGVAVRMIAGRQDRAAALVSSYTPLTLDEDLSWLLDRLAETDDIGTQQVLAKLIRLVFHTYGRDQVEQVLGGIEHNTVLADELSWLWRPVPLGSEEAKRLQEDYRKKEEFAAVKAEMEKSEQKSYDSILGLLDECDAGNVAVFRTLAEELVLRPRAVAESRLLEADLTVLPGWQRADGATRTRIVTAAKSYLVQNDAKPGEWLGTTNYDRAVFAGYKAFRLILSEDPDHLSSIPVEIWRNWAGVILAYPTRLGFGDEETFMRLVSRAFQVAPQEIVNALTLLIERENQKNGTISVTRKIRYCSGQAIERTLLTKLQDDTLTPGSAEAILDELLARNVPEARVYAEELVREASQLQGEARRRSEIAAHLLVFHTKDDGWRIVWSTIEKDDNFGLSVIPHLAKFDRINRSEILKSLSEVELGRLFGWLARHYPHHEDPDHDGVHWVDVREEIATWRDLIPIQLRDRGTREALDVLRHMHTEFPLLEGLKWEIAEALELYRKNTWTPPEPRQVLELALNRKKRLVRSERELLDAVSEAVRVIGAQLQGETPAAVFLWDHITDDEYKPKEEMSLSDYLKLQLEKELGPRGIVLNREVQIHKGEKTDIYVNAVSQLPGDAGYDSITVIIEVKGCWNPDLWKAMESQLVGKYLKNNPCKTGLYVVGWYNCTRWAVEDQKTKKLSKRLLAMNTQEAQERLDQQASSLSIGGRMIEALVLDTGLHKV